MAEPPSPFRAKPRLLFALVGLLLAFQWLLAWTASHEKSATFDEIAHVTAGISYWQNNDYRLQPENGNLPQRWVALPSWLAGTRLPPPDSKAWLRSDVWKLGQQTFYEMPGQDHWPRLSAARGMNAVLMTGVSLMVFIWVRRRWGDWVGLCTLLIPVLDPNLSAHGALATSDMAATLLLPASVVVYWWHLQRLSWRSCALSALVVGLACVSKFAAVLLLPAILILISLKMAIEPPASRRRIIRDVLLHGMIQIAAIIAVIWTFYGFRYAGINPGGPVFKDYYHPWSTVLGEPASLKHTLLQWLRQTKIFPEAFIYGGAYVAEFSQERLTFFRGELGTKGWLGFFPYLFLVKTPLSTLALICIGAGTALVGWRRAGLRSPFTAGRLLLATPFLVWSGVYLAASLATNLNIGHRHLLPLYPGLFVLCGAAVHALWRYRAALGGLLILLAVESFLIRPHYLAYFNPIDGGPEKAWTKVVDSSLDWGQDLPGTARWLKENNPQNEPVFLCYFGVGEPAYYGINARTLQLIPVLKPSFAWQPLRGGFYVISSTLMQLNVADPWLPTHMEKYQRLRASFTKEPLGSLSSSQREALNYINQSRLLLLYNAMRERKPVTVIGHSIRIYQLSEAEAHAIDFGFFTAPSTRP